MKDRMLALLVGLWACDDDSSGGGAAPDAQRRDDAAMRDATLADATLLDATLLDATPADATQRDAAPDAAPDAALDAAPDAAPTPDAGPAPERLCGQPFLTALAPRVEGLFLLSESDYPLDPILVPADGRQAVDITDALALYEGDPGAPTETRPAEDLRRRLVRLDDPEDPIAVDNFVRFGALFDFLDVQLDAEIYLRVGEVEVHVYYLGRTPCGELAGFHSISIET